MLHPKGLGYGDLLLVASLPSLLLDISDQAKPDLQDRATVDAARHFAETTGKRAAILVL